MRNNIAIRNRKKTQTIPGAIQLLSDSLTSIRNSINAAPAHEKLYHSNSWKQICACLDVLEDTTLAITAFQRKPECRKVKTDANAYLYLYGLLQALFVQQDAVFNLGEALDPDWMKKYPKPKSLFDQDLNIKNIRRIRNVSVGHPTEKKNGKEYGFIRRTSIFKLSFDVETTRSNGSSTKETFFINEAIYGQLNWVTGNVEAFQILIESKSNALPAITRSKSQ